jgi:hypothetical protein
MIGLTDETGSIVGLLAGVNEDDVDDLLVQTPGFKAMIERSRMSLQTKPPVSAEDMLAKLQQA